MIVLGILFLLILSFLTGSLLPGKIKSCFFLMPVGFFVLVVLLQIGYYPLEFLNIGNKYFHMYTVIIFLLIIMLSFSNRKKVQSLLQESLKKYKFWILLAFLFFILMALYSSIDLSLMNSDVNYYAELINQGVISNEVRQGISPMYCNQGYYRFLSSFQYLLMKFNVLNENINSYIILTWLSSGISIFFQSSITIFLCEKITEISKSKINKLIYIFTMISITLFNTWVIWSPSYGNTFRRIVLICIIFYMYEWIKEKNQYYVILLCILFQAYISFTSTGLFLGGMLLFSFIVYCAIHKIKGIFPLFVILIFPLLFFATFIKPVLIIPALILYPLLVFLLKFSSWIEEKLFSYYKPIIIVVVILFSIISIFFTNLEMQSFFFVPSHDLVYDLVSFDGLVKIIFSFAFWSLLLSPFVFERKRNMSLSWVIAIVTILVFFNPLVFSFVYTYLTNEVYWRITDLIFNPIIILLFIYICEKTDSKIYKIFISISLIVLSICNLNLMFSKMQFNFTSDYNRIYHIDESELELIRNFEQYLTVNGEEKDEIVVISQIFGIDVISNYDISNIFDFIVWRTPNKNGEFFETFKRKTHMDIEENRNTSKGCRYANERNVEYLLIDAQYNWDIEEGMWSCIEKIIDENGFRIFKLRYDLWEYNINMGYVQE